MTKKDIKTYIKEIYKEIEPALKDFEDTGILMTKSDTFEHTGKEMLENIGFIRGAFYRRIKNL